MRHNYYISPRSVVFFSVAALLLCGQAPAFASTCAQSNNSRDNIMLRHIEVDDAWSGTKVDFSAVYAQGKIYIAYYNAKRIFTIAEISLPSGIIRKKLLPNTFDGWDSHNYTMIETDNFGNLIVSGNMHASKLVYFLIDSSSLSIKSTKMIGKDEDRVTYPVLLRVGERILFLYRSGGSGDGVWLANEWSFGHWSRIGEVFSGHSGKGHVSAYPSRFVRSTDGYVHVAIVWRRTPDVSTNSIVTYAKTKDFRKWFSHSGEASPSALSPQGGDVVADIGENGGLTNNVQISVSPEKKPVITYTAYNQQGVNTVFVSYPNETGWTSIPIAAAKRRIEISGLGSIRSSTSGSAVNFSNHPPYVDAFFSGDGAYRTNLDAHSFSPTCEPSKITNQRQEKSPLPTGLTKATQNDIAVQGMNGARIRWISQGVNNDQPRECTSIDPQACNPPPTSLILDIPLN